MRKLILGIALLAIISATIAYLIYRRRPLPPPAAAETTTTAITAAERQSARLVTLRSPPRAQPFKRSWVPPVPKRR